VAVAVRPPYPLLADPDAAVGDAYDQPIRFGILGDLSDFFGRMPAVVIVDRRGEEPAIAAAQRPIDVRSTRYRRVAGDVRRASGDLTGVSSLTRNVHPSLS